MRILRRHRSEGLECAFCGEAAGSGPESCPVCASRRTLARAPVGRGWAPLLWELERKLRQLDPDYRILSVRERLGELDFQADHQTETGWRLIAEAQRRSAEICELCGSGGVPRDHGWVKTLCDGCSEGR